MHKCVIKKISMPGQYKLQLTTQSDVGIDIILNT